MPTVSKDDVKCQIGIINMKAKRDANAVLTSEHIDNGHAHESGGWYFEQV